MSEYHRALIEDLERELAEAQQAYRQLKSMRSQGLLSDREFKELARELLAKVDSVERKLLAARRPRRVNVRYAPLVAVALLLTYLSFSHVTPAMLSWELQLERTPLILASGSRWAKNISAKPGVELKLEVSSTLPLEITIGEENATLIEEESTCRGTYVLRASGQTPIKLEIANKSSKEASVILAISAVRGVKVNFSHPLFKLAALSLLAIGILLMWPRREL